MTEPKRSTHPRVVWQFVFFREVAVFDAILGMCTDK